jgi:hypothetical protein
MTATVDEVAETHEQDDTTYEHEGNEVFFEDYAHSLGSVPENNKATSCTVLEYGGENVVNSDLTDDKQERLLAVLMKFMSIMIASGNALPLPVNGVVCDIDVGRHASINQKSRRVPLKFLQ